MAKYASKDPVTGASVAWVDVTDKPTTFTPSTHTHTDKADLVGGTVPASQLPSYVDDIIEVANFAALPVTGESGKIYVTLDDNITYRWSGAAYVEVSKSIALGETSATAYRGDRGKTAYDHSQVTHNATLVGLGNVTNESKAIMFTNPTLTGTTTVTILAIGNYTFEIDSTRLIIKHSGTIILSLTSGGYLTTRDDQEILDSTP